MKADHSRLGVGRASAVVASRRDVGRGDAPADGGLDELRAKAANADERALATLAVNGDPADPLQRFGQILGRERADVLGGDGIDKMIGMSLPVERQAQASANADDDDFFDLSRSLGTPAAGRRIGSRRRGCNVGGCPFKDSPGRWSGDSEASPAC